MVMLRSRMRLVVVLAAVMVALAAPAAPAAGGLRGEPLIRRHAPEDYGARPRSFGVDTDGIGRVYVANADGVLRFDGHDWELLTLPGGMPARGVARGPDGRMYVASYDHFGVLAATADGRLAYEDLRPAFGLAGDEALVGMVWQVRAASDGVWFRGDRELYFLAMDPARHRRIPLPPEARSIYLVDDVVYLRIEGSGVARLLDGRLEPLPGAAAFADQPLSAVIARPEGLLLIGYRSFHLADAEGIRALPASQAGWSSGNWPYSAHALEDGGLLLGMRDGEIQRYDAQLRLVDRIPTGSFAIEAMARDREGGLWAATEGDLLRLRLPAPWSRFGAQHGLRGVINDSEWHDGALWLASTRGIGRLRPVETVQPRAEWFDWTEFEGFALQSTPAGLLIGHRDGIYVYEGGSRPRELIDDPQSVYTLLPSRHADGRIYAQGADRLWQLQSTAGRWQVVAEWPLAGTSANGLVEAGPGELWIGDSRGAPQRLLIDPDSGALHERRHFGEDDGIQVDASFGSRVFALDGRVHVVSASRGHVWNDGRFVLDEGALLGRVTRPMELHVAQTPAGDYAWTSRTLLWRPAGERAWQPVRFDDGARRGFVGVHAGSDGVIRVATWTALLQYQPGEPDAPPPPTRVRFAGVELDDPGQGVVPLPVEAPTPVSLPSGAQTYFRFAAVTMEPEVEFRFRVPGMTADWSDWSSERSLGIRVRPGDFTLEVEARTPDGRPIEPASWSFRGEPRWHETLWVRAAGVLAILALVLASNQWLAQARTRRYQAANRRLELRIAERTRELEDANRKLSELAIEDALTGLPNRRALEQGLLREWHRCREQHRPLAVLMIDVDHFKRYNDTHGHLEGDDMLRRVAATLQAECKPLTELLARFGGEEFALLLPGVYLEEAQRRAESLRRGFDRPGGGITVSIGVAAQVPGGGDGPHALLRRADAALYRAKRNGRNRVEIAND